MRELCTLKNNIPHNYCTEKDMQQDSHRPTDRWNGQTNGQTDRWTDKKLSCLFGVSALLP